LIDQIAGTDNIEVWVHTELAEAHGTERLEALTVTNNETGETKTVPAAALFLFIGAQAHTDLLDGVVERNTAGFIPTGQDLMRGGSRPKGWQQKRDPYLLETSVPGIFAAGDVRQGAVRRVATAVGEGAMAVSFVHQYLETV
jgi:thioredoxin reductase (NADPH)